MTDRHNFSLGGGGGEGGVGDDFKYRFPHRKLLRKKIVPGEQWEKIEQVLYTIQVLCLTVPKFFHEFFSSKTLVTLAPSKDKLSVPHNKSFGSRPST